MEAPKLLRQPSNWQDFETLCQKLWGEIWNCSEIMKNGRLGQDQSGVDIFGIPENENHYYGIQCKGKNEYNHAQFTEKEINDEIEKAKKFEPPLKKYYLATTATNDSKIQAFVRKKNLEHKSIGLFEVHLYSWESIVSLIDEHKQTHDFYVKSVNFKSKKSVIVSFSNELSEIIFKPKFKKTITHYNQAIVYADPLYQNPILDLINPKKSVLGHFKVDTSLSSKINLSYIPIEIFLKNNSDEPIEEYKVKFEFIGEFQDLSMTNVIEDGLFSVPEFKVYNTHLISNTKKGEIIPINKILVGDDILISDKIYLKPIHEESEIKIKWNLISKDFKENGELIIKVTPIIETEYKDVLVEDPFKVGTVFGDTEDYIVDKKE